MGRLVTTKRGRLSAPIKDEEDEIRELERLIEKSGYEIPKKRKLLNALRRVGGVLNVGTAFTSGLVKGALDEDTSALGEAFRSAGRSLRGEEIQGFADVARQRGVQPETRIGKVALATGGFIADVLFDPITYLTFGIGAGLRISGKTLTKAGTKLVQKAGTEITEVAGKKGIGKLRILLERALGKKGITEEAAEEAIKEGFSRGTIEEISQLGPKLINEGGIKFFGKTLIKSETLAKTPIGRAARALGETEVVQALKNTLGKLFVADFAKDPRLVSILSKAGREQRRAMEGILARNEELFKELSDDQMRNLFDTIFNKKLQIVSGGKEAKALQRGEKLTFEDEALQKVADQLFEGENAIVPRFAKLAGLSEEDAIKFYIPSKFADKLAIKNFAIGRGLASPEMGFLKKFRGVEEGLIKDPFEAYSRGQVEVVTARIKDSTARAVVQNLGRQFDELSEETAKRLGFVSFSRKGLGPTGAETIKGWLPKDIAKDLNNFLSPEFKTIDELAKVSGFDYVTGLFKGYVTSLFPGFHIRNVTSNQFQNMLKIGVDVGNPSLQKEAFNVVRGRNLDGIITIKTGQKLTVRQVRKMIKKESDVLEEGAFSRFEQVLEEGRQRLTRQGIQRFNPLSRENIALTKGREVGQFFEKQAKVVAILSEIRQGKNVKEAIKTAEEAIFNYRKLTEFERSIMRRLIPFYTFARKNAELQIKALAHTPGRVVAQLKFIKGAGQAVGEPVTEEDIEGLPDFVLENLGIKAGAYLNNQYGQSVFLTGFGLPIEEFLRKFSGEGGIISNLIMDTLSQANPAIKFPVERALDKDFFRNRPVSEIDKADGIKWMIDVMPEKVAEQFKDLIGWVEVPGQKIYINGEVVGERTKYKANPFVLHFMRNLFTSRIQSTIGFLTNEEEARFNQLLRVFTGVRGWAIDQEEQKFFNDLERSRELEDFLIKLGVGKKFQKFYIPKGKKLKR